MIKSFNDFKLNENFPIMLKVRMVMMSHLSDVQEFLNNPENRKKINFVKFLMLKYPNTDIEINPDEEWQKFIIQHP